MGTDSAPIPQEELPIGNSETALQGRLEIENQEFVEKYGPEFNGVWFVSDRVFDEGHQLASHMGGVRRIILGMNDVDPASFARYGFPRSEADLVLSMGTNGGINSWDIISSISKVIGDQPSLRFGTSTENMVVQDPSTGQQNWPSEPLNPHNTYLLHKHLREELLVLNSLIRRKSISEAITLGYRQTGSLLELCKHLTEIKDLSPNNEPYKITILGRPWTGKSSISRLINLTLSETRSKIQKPTTPLVIKAADLYSNSTPQDYAGIDLPLSDKQLKMLRASRFRYNRTGFPHLSPAYVANKIAGIYGIPNPTNPHPPRETQSPALWLVDTGGLPTFKLPPEQLDQLAHDDEYFQDNLHLLYDLPSLIAMNSSDLVLYLESDNPDLDSRLLAIADTFCPGRVAMLKNPFLRNPDLLRPSVIRSLRDQNELMDDHNINDMLAQFLEETMRGIEQKYAPNGNLNQTIQNLICHIRDYHFRQGNLTVLRSLGLTDDQIARMCQIEPPTISSDWSLTDDLIRFADIAF